MLSNTFYGPPFWWFRWYALKVIAHDFTCERKLYSQLSHRVLSFEAMHTRLCTGEASHGNAVWLQVLALSSRKCHLVCTSFLKLSGKTNASTIPKKILLLGLFGLGFWLAFSCGFALGGWLGQFPKAWNCIGQLFHRCVKFLITNLHCNTVDLFEEWRGENKEKKGTHGRNFGSICEAN